MLCFALSVSSLCFWLGESASQGIERIIKGWLLQVMANLKAVLEAAGGSFDNVVKTTVLLADMGDFAAVNEVYGATSYSHSGWCFL